MRSQVASTSFLPTVTPCKTVAQYYDQKIDIDKVHQFYLDWISFTYTCAFSSMQFDHRYRFMYPAPH